MFYEIQDEKSKNKYRELLTLIGELSRLFSKSADPYLPYRYLENVFCLSFDAENLAREDCSIDAKKNFCGIGLKTWVGSNDQKVAEFGKLKNEYYFLRGIKLVRKISEYRNDRITTTKNKHKLEKLIYHIVRRDKGKMEILEHPFPLIDIDRLKVLNNQGKGNNTYFTDGKYTYHFSTSKNTLYMVFDEKDLKKIASFDVKIMENPYYYLLEKKKTNAYILDDISEFFEKKISEDTLQLNLYSYSKKRGNFVPEKSGLNQWNAGGRARNPNELYIPYPACIKAKNPDFFPGRDTPFKLILPDGTELKAKVCQDGGKAIMSDPNKDLGRWLLRDVFNLEEGQLVTYLMLQRFGIDSVLFRKLGNNTYSVDFIENNEDMEVEEN